MTIIKCYFSTVLHNVKKWIFMSKKQEIICEECVEYFLVTYNKVLYRNYCYFISYSYKICKKHITEMKHGNNEIFVNCGFEDLVFDVSYSYFLLLLYYSFFSQNIKYCINW